MFDSNTLTADERDWQKQAIEKTWKFFVIVTSELIRVIMEVLFQSMSASVHYCPAIHK